jgi:hypothetical protein
VLLALASLYRQAGGASTQPMPFVVGPFGGGGPVERRRRRKSNTNADGAQKVAARDGARSPLGSHAASVAALSHSSPAIEAWDDEDDIETVLMLL